MADNQFDIINGIIDGVDFDRVSGWTAPTEENLKNLLKDRLGEKKFSQIDKKAIDEGLKYYVEKWGEHWGKQKGFINQTVREIIKTQTINELKKAKKDSETYIDEIKNQLTQRGYRVEFNKDSDKNAFDKNIKDTVGLVLKEKKEIDKRVQTAFKQIKNYSNNQLGKLLKDTESPYIDQVLEKELKKQGVISSQFPDSDRKRVEQRFVKNLKEQQKKRVKEIYNQTYKYEREQLNQLSQAKEYSFEQKELIKASPYLGKRAQALRRLNPSQGVYEKVQKELEIQSQDVQKAIDKVDKRQTKISRLVPPEKLEGLLEKYYKPSEVQDFLSGKYIKDILKGIGGSAEQALKKGVNTEIGIGKMFEQLKSVAEQKGYTLQLAFDETNKVLETFLLTKEEVAKYKKDSEKALEGFRAQGSTTLRLKMGFGKDGAPLGHTITKGAMESPNTLKLVRGENLLSVGTGLEATLLRLISLLGKPGWTPESAVKSVKKQQNQEEFAQQLNAQQRNLLVSQLSITPIIQEVAWQVGQKIGATSLDRVVEKLNTAVYNLAVAKANTGEFNWGAIQDSYKFPENVKSVLGMVASFVSTLPLQHMALGSNKGIREGVYTLAPAYFQSPSPVISPNYSKHTSQALKTGEYSNTAKLKRVSRQAAGHSLRFVDEKTAEALKDSENQTVKQIQASGQLATFDTLYVEAEQVEKGYEFLKETKDKVTADLKNLGYTEEQINNILDLRQKTIDSYKKRGITPQNIIGGGIEGDAAIVSSEFAENFGTTVKSRAPIVLDQDVFKTAVEQGLSGKKVKDWDKFFSTDKGRKIIKQIIKKEKNIRPEDIIDLDVYQSDGKIQISFTEKQDLQISGKIGSGLQGERNMTSLVPQEFIKLVGALNGIENTDAHVIRQYDTASTNETGGRLMAILQKGLEEASVLNEFSDKTQGESSILTEFFEKTFGENSPLRGFFEVFTGSDGEAYIQAKKVYDKQGKQIFLDFEKAAEYLSGLTNSLGEKMFPHIGKGSRAFVGADTENVLLDYEYRNKISLGERERLSYLKGLEVAEKELGGKGHFKVLKKVFEDGIFGPTQSSLQAEKEKEAIKKNLAKSTEKDIDETNTIIIGKGGDIDISSLTSDQKEQLLTMDYSGRENSMGAKAYDNSIFKLIEHAKQEKIEDFKDKLISVEGLSEGTKEFQKRMQEFIDSLSVAVVSADKNAAFFRYGKEGKEFTGQNLRFSLQEIKTYKNLQTGEIEGYSIPQTLTGLTNAIELVDDFDKKITHEESDYNELAKQGGQIVERLQKLISDPKGAYNTAIFKREIENSGWFSGQNVTVSKNDKKRKLYSDAGEAGEGANTDLTIAELKQIGVGLGRNALKKALSQDKKILQKRVALMYGKTLKQVEKYTIDELQEAIVSAVDISNKTGEFKGLGKAVYRELVGEIFRDPIINNQWDILSTLFYTSKDIKDDSESGFVSQALASRDRGDFDKDHWAFTILENEKIKKFSLQQLKDYDRLKREQAYFYARFTKTNAYFRKINKLDQPDEEIFKKVTNIPEVLNPILQEAAQNNQGQVGLMSLTHSNISNLAREKGLNQILNRSLEFLFSSGEQNMVGYKHLIKKITSEPAKFLPQEYKDNEEIKNGKIKEFLANQSPEVQKKILKHAYAQILSAGNEKVGSFIAGKATATDVFDDFIKQNIIGTDGKNIAKTSFNFELLAQILSGYENKEDGLEELKSILSEQKVNKKIIDNLKLINFGYIKKDDGSIEQVTEKSGLKEDQEAELGSVPVVVLRALIKAGEKKLTEGLVPGTRLATAASNYRNRDRQDMVYNETQMFNWLKGTGEAIERVSKEVSEKFKTVPGYLQEIASQVENIVKILGGKIPQGSNFSNKEKKFLEQIRQTTLSAQIAGNNTVFKKSATYDPELYNKVGTVELTKKLLNKAGTQYRKNVTFKDFAKAYGYEDETEYQKKIGSSINAAIGTQFHGLNEMALKEAEEYYKSNGNWEGFYKNSLLAKVYNAKDGASALKALQRVEKDERAKEIGVSFKPYLEQLTKTLARVGITSESNPELYKQYMERGALSIKVQLGSILQDIISKKGKVVGAETSLWRKQKTPTRELGVLGHADLIGVGEEQYAVIEAGKEPTLKTRNVGTVYDYKNKFNLAGSQKVDLQYVSQVAGYIRDLRDLQALFNSFKFDNRDITSQDVLFGEGKDSFISFLKKQGYNQEAIDQITASEGLQQALMQGVDWSRGIISYLGQNGESKTVELDFSNISPEQMQKLLGGEPLEKKEFYNDILPRILKSNIYVDEEGNIQGPKTSSEGSSNKEESSSGGGSGKKSRDPYAQTAKEYESHMIEAIRLQKEYEINQKRIASEPLSKRGKELLKLENVDLVEQIALHKQIARELEKEASQSEKFGRTQQKLTREIQKAEHSVVTYGQGASNIFEKMGIDIKRAFMRIFDGSLIYKFFGLVQRGFSQTIQLAKQLDKSMVNLRIVTGGTKSETRELVNVYAQLAKQLGVTTQEVVNGATEWLRQGYTVQESQKLVTASIYLSKLGMIESGQATEYLTSVLKGFKLETSEAVSVVDKLTKVDLEAATSAGNIAEALSRTSVSAQNAGVDLDKLIGYVTEVLQVTQKSASSVGESFKTIFARYQNVKASAFKSMDLSEEAAETTEGINDIERVLNKVGIKIRTSSKEFASFDSILAQLAGNWIKYSSVEKAAISTAIAGTRQRENFLALMENYNEAMDIAATSTASAGTAEEKYAAYTEGMEASVSGLTAAWEKLIAKLKASEGLKWLVDSAKKLLDLLPHITGLLSQLTATGFSKFAVPRVIGSLMGTGQLLKEKFSATEEQKMARAQELLAADGIHGAPGEYKEYSRRTRRRVSRSFAKDRLNKSIEDEQEKIDLARQKTKEKAGSFETRFKDTIKTGISDPLEKIAKTAENIQLALEEQQSQEENSSSTDNKPTEQGSGVVSESAASSLKTLRFKKDGSLDLRTLKWAGVSKDTDPYKYITTLFKAYEENPDKEGAFQSLQNSLKELGFEVDNTSLKIRANGEATESNTSSTQKDTQETKDHAEKVEENTGATSANTDAKKKDTSQEQGAKKAGKGLAIGSKIASGVLSGVAAGIGAGLTTVAKDAEGNTYEASTAAKATVGTLQGVSAATAAIPMVGPAVSAVLGTIVSAAGPSIAAAIDKDKIEKEKQLKLAQEQLDALNDIKSGTQSIKQEVIGNEKLSSREQLTSLYTTVNELQKQAGNNGQLAQALVEETSKLGISDWAGTYYNIYDLTVEEREKFLDAIERAINIATMSAQDNSSEAESYEEARKALGLKDGKSVSSVKDRAVRLAAQGDISGLKTFQSNVAKIEAYERERIKLIMDNLYSESQIAYETEDRLQQLGLEGIQEEVLNKLGPETAKILQGLGAIDGSNNLTDLGEQIFNQLVKSDQRMYSVINPSSMTLKDIYAKMPDKEGGEETNKTAEQAKEEFAKVLGVSIESLNKLYKDEYWGPLLSNLSAEQLSSTTAPEDFQNKITTYAGYLSTLASSDRLTPEEEAALPTELKGLKGADLKKELKSLLRSYQLGYATTNVMSLTENSTKLQAILKQRGGDFVDEKGEVKEEYKAGTLTELLFSSDNRINKKALRALRKELTEFYEKQAKDLVGTKILESVSNVQQTFLKEQLNNLSEQKEALQNINKQREYELKLIKAKQQLEDARKEKKRVWREGIGWTYESDQEGIAEAQKNLEEVQAEKQTEDLQQQIDLLTAQKELLEELPDKNQFAEYTKAYKEWLGDVSASQAEIIQEIKKGYESVITDSKYILLADKEKTTEETKEETSDTETVTDINTAREEQEQWQTTISPITDVVKDAEMALGLGAGAGGISEDQLNKLLETAKIDSKLWGRAKSRKLSTDDITEENSNKFKNLSSLITAKAKENSDWYSKVDEHVSLFGDKELFDNDRFENVWSNQWYSLDPNLRLASKWKDNRSWSGFKTYFKDNLSKIEGAVKWFSKLSLDQQKEIYNSGVNGKRLGIGATSYYGKLTDKSKEGHNMYLALRQIYDIAEMNSTSEWDKKFAYASGTFAAEGPALINELGTEGIITPQGTITAFNGPHGVVPASLTKNLAELGLEAPRLIKELSSVYGLNKDYSGHISNVHDESINARQILVQINADKDFNMDRFVEELKSSVVLNKQNHKI